MTTEAPITADAPGAGWYPDPVDPYLERYWDGTTWLEGTRLRQAPPPPPPGWVTAGYPQPTVAYPQPGAASKSRLRRALAIGIIIIGSAVGVTLLGLVSWVDRTSESEFAPTADEFSACAIDTAGQAWCWDGDSSAGDIPVAVPGPIEADLTTAEDVPGGRTFNAVTNNDWQSCALDTAGKAWCWRGPHDPVPVAGEHIFRTIAADGEETCALDTSGRAWCWSDGYVAVPGDGDAIVRTTRAPVAVPGKHTFTSIGGSCALDTAGKAWCWGDGEEGQLGNADPSVDHTDKPVPVAGGHTFTTIVPGSGESRCALDTAGNAWCWGDDESGELADGDESGADKYMPVPVAGGHTFTTLTDRQQNWCGLNPDGKAKCEYWSAEDW